MTTADARSLIGDLRLQAYGTSAPGKIQTPIVEPLWAGIRVLAAVNGDDSALLDVDGEPVTDWPAIEQELRTATAADAAVIDGFLTKQVAQGESALGKSPGATVPSRKVVAKSMVGSGHDRRAEITEQDRREREASEFGPDDAITFVAIDLLHLDGESLLDVPLLERKRLLEAVVSESDLVRRSAYVSPPIGTWVSSWKTLGFPGLTFKAANGRYRPGGVKDDWVTSPMPRR